MMNLEDLDDGLAGKIEKGVLGEYFLPEVKRIGYW